VGEVRKNLVRVLFETQPEQEQGKISHGKQKEGKYSHRGGVFKRGKKVLRRRKAPGQSRKEGNLKKTLGVGKKRKKLARQNQVQWA